MADGWIAVVLDDRPFQLLAGSRVIDLLGLLPPDVQLAYANGAARFVDAHGNEVGSHGDLVDGQRLRLERDV